MSTDRVVYMRVPLFLRGFTRSCVSEGAYSTVVTEDKQVVGALQLTPSSFSSSVMASRVRVLSNAA
jgi:hypothetical protein